MAYHACHVEIIHAPVYIMAKKACHVAEDCQRQNLPLWDNCADHSNRPDPLSVWAHRRGKKLSFLSGSSSQLVDNFKAIPSLNPIAIGEIKEKKKSEDEKGKSTNQPKHVGRPSRARGPKLEVYTEKKKKRFGLYATPAKPLAKQRTRRTPTHASFPLYVTI